MLEGHTLTVGVVRSQVVRVTRKRKSFFLLMSLRNLSLGLYGVEARLPCGG